MRFKRPGGTWCLLVLAAVLGWAFSAYQDPVHVAQWLPLLQLCR